MLIFNVDFFGIIMDKSIIRASINYFIFITMVITLYLFLMQDRPLLFLIDTKEHHQTIRFYDENSVNTKKGYEIEIIR